MATKKKPATLKPTKQKVAGIIYVVVDPHKSSDGNSMGDYFENLIEFADGESIAVYTLTNIRTVHHITTLD